ncbi:piggyBac transposable element-derived protein 4-like [Odontomachus brunneus]|uniref:piggyBac transposable element-derived protein 4-like n=1 Tax=Odontomachus brunneus TaxID=486640 RepID=UPI0013F248B2|nr:piggyBac transposable element-derived protein 4-like [Odontomachus brunneus]
MEVDEETDYLSNAKIFYDNNFYPSVKDFDGESSIREDIPLTGFKPLHYFELLFDLSMLEIITQETNRYQSQNPESYRLHMQPWVDLTVEELKTFIDLTILMGHVRKGSIQDYWSTDSILLTSIFRQTMSRNRYLQILRYLHFQNNKDTINHPLKKIKPIIDDLNEKFSNTINAGRNLCIDESLLLWKGKLKFKQFIPLKRNRFGIKLFELVDCKTGFILAFIVYTGKDTDYEKFELGISGDIVVHFVKPYFSKGHVIFIDNWYSSPQLAEFLHEHDTGVCGTVRKNRKEMPDLNSKLNRGEIEIGHNLVWMAMKWADKRDVYMLTSVHEVGFSPTGKKDYITNKEIIKPTCIIEYNKNMGGIDNIDRQLSLTESIRKTMKWYRKLFFHLLDLSLTSDYII